MCLDTVIRVYKRLTKRPVRAWKQVWRSEYTDLPSTLAQTYPRSFPLSIGKWVRVGQYGPGYLLKFNDIPRGYRPGFHAYRSRGRDNNLTVHHVPVLLKGVRTVGKQRGRVVYVADWIKVLRG